MSTRYQIIDAIALGLPKLTKQRHLEGGIIPPQNAAQLSELLLLVQAWSNGIPLVNIKHQPIEIQKLASEVKSLQLLVENLELKNYRLKEELKESRDRASETDGTVRAIIAENRKLKNQFFMQPGVRK